jgi:hypothetical protein
MPASIAALTQYFSANQAILIGTDNGGWSARSPFENTAWKYASATTITVTGDATLYYQVGDKVRLKQGGSYKYFYIITVAAALLTITGGSDYTLTNADITDVEISRAAGPTGFPAQHNWSPTLVGFSANPGFSNYRFHCEGRRCFVSISQLSAGTSNAVTLTISAPITAATVSVGFWGAPFLQGTDNGAALTTPGQLYMNSADTVITAKKDISGTTWTAANGKAVSGQFWYEI